MNNSCMQFMRQNGLDRSMPPLQRGNALTIPVLCLALQVDGMGGQRWFSSIGLVCLLRERSSNKHLAPIHSPGIWNCHVFLGDWPDFLVYTLLVH